MTILANVDPWLRVQAVFDVSFRTLFPLPGVCRQVGFTGISERLADPPGWFLWLDGDPGAYSLELAWARRVRAAGLDACQGTFAVRYFPAGDDHSLPWHTAEERNLRAGPGFDATGTPRFAHLDRIAGRLFQAGFLDLAVHLDRDALEFRLRGAPSVPGEQGAVSAASPAWARAERRKHDWLKSWTLADKLFLAVGRHFRLTPQRAAMKGQALAGGSCDLVLTVAFQDPSVPCRPVFPSGGTPHGHPARRCGEGGGLTPWINKQWWRIAQSAPHAGEAAMPECGCLAHRH